MALALALALPEAVPLGVREGVLLLLPVAQALAEAAGGEGEPLPLAQPVACSNDREALGERVARRLPVAQGQRLGVSVPVGLPQGLGEREVLTEAVAQREGLGEVEVEGQGEGEGLLLGLPEGREGVGVAASAVPVAQGV